MTMPLIMDRLQFHKIASKISTYLFLPENTNTLKAVYDLFEFGLLKLFKLLIQKQTTRIKFHVGMQYHSLLRNSR